MRVRINILLPGLLLVLITCLSTYGQQNKEPEKPLSVKQESIVPIAAYVANGDQAGLKVALNQGLDAGLTINEIKEILVQLYAYAGFPRSLNGISTLQGVLKMRSQSGISDLAGNEPSRQTYRNGKFAYGKDVQTKLTGSTAIGAAQTFVPIIDTLLKEHLFADIFGRDNLDYQSREIATISALASLGGVEGQLRGHLNVGKNVGLTERQLRSVASKLSSAIYHNAGNAATKILDTMFGSSGTSNLDAAINETISQPTFSQGSKVVNGNFTGNVWVSRLTSLSKANSTSIANVTFAPKARSNWHMHPSGQVLLITDGIGYYQERGKPIRLIRKGDVINCPPEIAHWHGASHNSSMSHLALGPEDGKGPVVWLERVKDEEYNKAS